jgi:hypothetical protein
MQATISDLFQAMDEAIAIFGMLVKRESGGNGLARFAGQAHKRVFTCKMWNWI